MNESNTIEKAPDNQIALPNDISPGAALAALTGNIERLSDTDKAKWLVNLCKSVGLNPMSCPFDIINFKGVTKVYANKGCAEQLRQINGINLEVVSEEIKHGSYVVRIKAKNAQGRIDENIGAVPWDDKWGGEIKSLAMMKAHTKAARRVTLSICGLGMMDESEIEDMKRAKSTLPDPEESASAKADILNRQLEAPKSEVVQEQPAKVEVLSPEKPPTSPLSPERSGTSPSATEGGDASEGASASPVIQSKPEDLFGQPEKSSEIQALTPTQKMALELQTVLSEFKSEVSMLDCIKYCHSQNKLPVGSNDLGELDPAWAKRILTFPKAFIGAVVTHKNGTKTK